MTLERGTLLHKRYRIVEILGQGGMGSVYRAVDENLGVEVAVKENLFTTDEYARQFRLEAVILANLRHPNLPRVTDHFVIGEQGQYLVMDYIEGEDLRQRMERIGTLPDQEVILIGAAMCDALDYLHSRRPPIVHRDVKPGNVKITPDGHIFLVDFGLAKVVQGSQVTTTGARAMTPGYSPPEQYGTARTDARTDIYSLGATLYAALTGVIPEDGLARAMDNAQLTPIRKRNPRVSRRLAAAIEKSMAVLPDDRFQTALEFKKALLAANSQTQRMTGEYVVSPPPAAESRPKGDEKIEKEARKTDAELPLAGARVEPPSRPPVSRRRGGAGCWPAVLGLLLVAVLGLIALAVFVPELPATLRNLLQTATPVFDFPVLVDETPTATPEPPTSTPTLTPTPEPTSTPTATPTETLTPTPTLIAGGFSQLAFASNRSGVPQIYLVNFDGTGLRALTNMPQGACQPDWSPDGQRLVFVSPCLRRQDTYQGSSLYVINADGSGLTPLPTTGDGDFDPDWSPDGNRIAFTSTRSGRANIFVLNLADGQVLQLTNSKIDETSSQPAWSPFGNQLLYVFYRPRVYQIWSVTDSGLSPMRIVLSGSEYWDLRPTWSPDGEIVYFHQRQTGPSSYWLMKLGYDDRMTGDARRIPHPNLSATNPAVSPDGLWLAFEGVTEGFNADIYVMMTDGSNLRALTKDPGVDFDPAWRPGQP